MTGKCTVGDFPKEKFGELEGTDPLTALLPMLQMDDDKVSYELRVIFDHQMSHLGMIEAV